MWLLNSIVPYVPKYFRILSDNELQGTIPAQISALVKLDRLCAPFLSVWHVILTFLFLVSDRNVASSPDVKCYFCYF